MSDTNFASFVDSLIGGTTDTFLVCAGTTSPVAKKTAAEVRSLLGVYTTAQVDSAVAAKIGGSVGATDNRLVRSDGTGTLTVQSTGITVDDSNNVSGVGTLASGAITASGGITSTGSVTANTINVDDGSALGVLNLTTVAGRTGQIKHNGTLVAQLTAYSSDVTFYKSVSLSGNTLSAGAITSSGAVSPASSGSQALGSTSAYWGTVHLTTLRSSGAITVNTNGTGYGNLAFGSTGYLDADQLIVRSNNQASTRLSVSSSVFSLSVGFNLAAITKAALLLLTPTATAGRWRVTDATPANREAYPDGTNWRYTSDDTVVT